MEIKFISSELLDFFTGSYSGKQKFSQDIITRYKDKIAFIIQATNLNELSKMRSMNIEKYKSHWSARINRQYRIEFEFIKPNTKNIETL